MIAEACRSFTLEWLAASHRGKANHAGLSSARPSAASRNYRFAMMFIQQKSTILKRAGK